MLHKWLRFWAVTPLLVGLLLAVPGHAADKAQVAKTMATQASKAYAAGDYGRAAELYLNAWRTDGDPGYLWALARAEHLAGLLEQALEHYKLFIAGPGEEAARVPKAKDYMADIVSGWVAIKIRDAEYAMRSKDYVSAGLLYRDAMALAPDRADLLLRAALAEFAAEHWPESEDLLVAYLNKAPADAPDRKQAEERLKAARRKQSPEAIGKPAAMEERLKEVKIAEFRDTPAPPEVPVAAKAVDGPSRMPAYLALGGGALLATAGAVVYARAAADLADYNQKMASKNAAGKVVGISFESAQPLAEQVNRELGIAVGLGVASVACAGVGVWLLVREPERKVVVVPTGAGMLIAWRF